MLVSSRKGFSVGERYYEQKYRARGIMERKHSIDLLRVISCLAVIAIHVISGPMSTYSGILDTNLTSILEKTHGLLNWSVPVFFMITGYCIIGKKEYTYRHCFKHVRKFLVVLATVGFLFALLEEVFIHGRFSFSVLLKSLQNVLNGNLWDHMWYLYAVIGVYLVLPVLHAFMSTEKSNRLILTGLLFVFTIVLPSFEKIITIGIEIPFGGYLFYVCFGGMVAKGDVSKKQTLLAVIAGLLAALFIVLSPDKNDFGYRSLLICLIALGIFVFVCKFQMKPNKLVKVISQCTFGMYLMHPLFINVAVKMLRIDVLSHMPYIKLTAFYIGICLISFTAVYIYLKIQKRMSQCRLGRRQQDG
jgi:surface polysaccharide O-acyltransferase-like enzyme